ncbi:glycosyltransferase [uncultured Fibrobacter sp.]|uniref:glycosyltransferase family 2 protein n=1 Tax=uncultured Fibrobacter sp. TaxID=261512 RepID=UPI00260DA0D9|nr:glycosyltransferase [uncultured Fibrobacter sp.]
MSIPKIVHYAFVVLHYGDATVTMEAIESIRSLDRGGRNVSVIVVDNASPNGTGEQVKKQIESLPDFYYIHNEENLGFARGNNVGFKYAKNELKADFIVLMNNDAVIESADFFALVEQDYSSEKFAVLGPSIRTPVGKEQNPLRLKMLCGFRLKLTVAYLWVDLLATFLLISPMISCLLKKFPRKQTRQELSAMNNVELHGSFLIFSPKYIGKFDGLDDRTFMYCEEEFLFARCMFNNLKTRFNPAIRIFHNEVENRRASILRQRKKRLFRVKNCLKSLKIYSRDVVGKKS